MKKIIIPIMILMMLMMTSFASAGLTTLGGSQIDFLGSDGTFGQAYLMSVVENGGSNRIYFADFPSPSGYTKTSNSGYIEGDLLKLDVEYSYTQRYSSVYEMNRLNGGNMKYSWGGWPDAQEWCLGLGGDMAARDGVLSKLPANYYCYEVQEVGKLGDINEPRYNWQEKFTIYNKVSGESSETTSITIDGGTGDTSGYYEYAPNRKIQVKYAFSGGTLNSAIPQIQSDYDIWYQGGNVYTIESFQDADNRHGSYRETLEYFGEQWLGEDNWYNFYTLGNAGWFPSASRDPYLVEVDIKNYNSNRIKTKSISVNDWTTNIDQASGAITMKRNDGQFPIANVFTMKIDAEWVGIEEPVGKPVIDSWSAKGDKFIEGDYNAGFEGIVTNEGDSSSFAYIMTCSPSGYVSIDSRNQESYNAGQTKSFSVRAYANTAGENVNAECCLQVKDYNDPSVVSAKKCDSITFLESNQCPSGMEAGHSTCSNDQILQCMKNNDGVLVLQSTGQTCEFGCSISGSTAVCSQKPTCTDKYASGSYCGDGRCESFERTGNECECLDDCSTCGDKYCSTLEKEADNCPQDCGAKPYCGNDLCGLNEYGIQETDVKGTAGYCPADCGDPKPNVNWPLIIFGIVGGGAMAGAIVLRLKKEGYIGKK